MERAAEQLLVDDALRRQELHNSVAESRLNESRAALDRAGFGY